MGRASSSLFRALAIALAVKHAGASPNCPRAGHPAGAAARGEAGARVAGAEPLAGASAGHGSFSCEFRRFSRIRAARPEICRRDRRCSRCCGDVIGRFGGVVVHHLGTAGSVV